MQDVGYTRKTREEQKEEKEMIPACDTCPVGGVGCADENKVSAQVRKTQSWYQPLFDHMEQEHGLVLTESELDEIMEVCKKMKKKEPRRCWVVMDSVVADNEGDWYQAYRSRKDAERNASERDSVVEMVEKEREG